MLFKCLPTEDAEVDCHNQSVDAFVSAVYWGPRNLTQSQHAFKLELNDAPVKMAQLLPKTLASWGALFTASPLGFSSGSVCPAVPQLMKLRGYTDRH